MSCLFCDIVNKKIPADIVYESDNVIGFRDISPQAPDHVLVIPRVHTESIMSVDTDHETMNQIVHAIQEIATQLGCVEDGFRVVTNSGTWGGQTVDHLHFHILGGRPLSWPPG